MLTKDFTLLRGTYLPTRNACLAGAEPLVFHCHHYNTFLQNTLEDASAYLPVHPILVESAQEIVHGQFKAYFREQPHLSIPERKQVVEDYFRYSGFGKVSLSGVSAKGGMVQASSDHYGIGYRTKFGPRHQDASGVSFFTAGYVAGATEAIYDAPLGSLSVRQTDCLAKGDPESRFVLAPSQPRKALRPSPREGLYQMAQLRNAAASPVDYLAIREALTQMPIEGGPQDGLIDAFGVLLTRMYANYYALISYRFLNAMEAEMGPVGVSIAKELLVEAGHTCAFYTFGGIMQSAEWAGLIQPMLRSREDWVHGIVACVNAFGWGFWQVAELVPGQKLVIRIKSGYEANAYLGAFGQSTLPISFLATGGTAGIMNLLYHGDVTSHPELSDAYYQQTFKHAGRFTATQTRCRAMGDEYDEFVAERDK